MIDRRNLTGSINRSMLQKHLVQTTSCHGCCLWSVSLLSNPVIVYSRMRANWLVWSTGSPLLAWKFHQMETVACAFSSVPAWEWGLQVIWWIYWTRHTLKDFGRGRKPEMLEAGHKGWCHRLKKKIKKLLPVCVPTCWGVCPCSIYNRWGFTHAF